MGSPVRDIGVSMRQLLILSSLTLAVSAFDNAMQWLTDDLFNDQRYDKTLIPIEEAPMQSGENAVSLGIGLTLRNLDMDAAGNLRVNAWVKATWKDYRLSWEPGEYEGIKKLNLPSDMIWRPDISIYNQASYSNDDADKQLRKSDYNTIILADGTVIWIPPVSFTVDCTYRKRGGVMTMEDPNAEQDGARDRVQLKSIPSKSESISMVACVDEDRVRFARSHCVRNRRSARWLPAKSLPRFLRLKSCMQKSTIRLSKSSPSR